MYTYLTFVLAKKMSYLKLITIVIFVLLQGCGGMHYKDVENSLVTPQFSLHDWPYEEYWTGIEFNNSKIGFSHLRIGLDEKRPGTFLINSEASLHFHFLTTDKKVTLTSRDWVNPDLTINGFVYEYNLDGNQMKLYGVVRNNILTVVIDSSAGRVTESHPLTSPLYPTSVINLYPALYGLELNATYEYMVYDGESQRLTSLTQDVSHYEVSNLFKGEAYKVNTSMQGQIVTTWINANAEPLLELSMDGVFIASLESEDKAKDFLTQAALNKEDTLLDFSLIETDQILNMPRQTSFLELELTGAEAMHDFPTDLRQQCSAVNNIMRCRINGSQFPVEIHDMTMNYLSSSMAIPTQHVTIRNISNLVTLEAITDSQKVEALLNWIKTHIRPELTDVFSALDVLKQRKAECQGFSLLFASFARAAGIPTRVVNGIVYSEQHPGFLYHTWVESQIEGQWQAIDPILGQLHADATHIKLVEGDNLADLTPLLAVIGKLSAKIVEVKSE
ncbi:MAG: hypothetical protein ACI9XC_001731 [Gammaproteobacteria bacterium]|jgi:hypothetical protein